MNKVFTIYTMFLLLIGNAEVNAQFFSENTLLRLPFNDSLQDVSSYNILIPQGAYPPTSTTNRFSKSVSAIQFDGDSQSLVIGNFPHLQPSFPFTYNVWVLFDSIQDLSSPIYFSNNHENVFAGASISISSQGRFIAELGDNNGSGSQNRKTFTGSSNLINNTWYNLSAVFHSINDVRLFINGIRETETISGTANSLVYNSEPGMIGSTSKPNSPFLSIAGKIDDLMIIKDSLNSKQIQFLLGLRLSLPMNGTGQDYSSGSNDGLLTNVSPTKDRFGLDSAALSFNGQNSQFSILDDQAYKVQFPFSLSFWFKPDSFEAWNLFSNNSHDFQRYRGIWSNNTTQTGLGTSYGNNVSSGPNGRYTIRNNDTLKANFWHHYVAIFEDSRTSFIYINGVRDTSVISSGSASIIYYDNGPAEIGFYKSPFNSGNTIDYFKGEMDELYLWSLALDSIQVKSLFKPGIYTAQQPADIMDSVGKSVQFNASFVGTGGAIGYLWQYSNGTTWTDIPNSNSDVLTIPSILVGDSGLYRCIGESFGARDTTLSARLTVLSSTVGLEGLTIDQKPSIYPNPASKFLNINHRDNIKSVEILNSLGKTVIEEKGDRIKSVNIMELPAGLYIAIIKDEIRKYSLRWIKL